MTSAEHQPPVVTPPLLARSTAQFGVIVFLASDVMLFAPFFAAYFLLRATNQPWPPEGVELDVLAGLRRHRRARRVVVHARRRRTAPASVRRRAGDAPLAARDDHPRRGVPRQPDRSSTRRSTSAPTTTRTARIYWLLTGLHGAHVTAGLAAMGLLFVRSVRSRSHVAVATWAGGVSLFWHLVDVIWVFVFTDDLGHAVNVLLRRPGCRGRSCAGIVVVRRPAGHGDAAHAGRRRARRRALRDAVRQLPRHRRHGRRGPRPGATDEGRRPSTSCCAPGGCRWPRRTWRPSAGRCATARTRSGPRRPTPAPSATGPPIPDVDPAAGDLASGGELYRSTARPATWRPAPGRRSAAAARRPDADVVDPDARSARRSSSVPARCPCSDRSPTTDIDSVAAYVEELQAQETTGARRLRRRRTRGRGLGRVAARAAPADRPHPLDRHARTRAATRRSRRTPSPRGAPDVTAARSTAGRTARRSSPSPSPIAGGIAAAIGYGTGEHGRPARARARRGARRHRVRPGLLGQVPRPRRARRAAARAAAVTPAAARGSCTTSSTHDRRHARSPQLLVGAARRVVRQPGRRVRGPDRFARAEAARRARPHVVACRVAVS